MWYQELATPSAIIDLQVLTRNARTMVERISQLGARLRPHVKTHKCVEAARIQVRGACGGITVSTLAEARFFAEAGFRDITYAVPIAPARLAAAAKLAGRIDRLTLLADHPATVAAIASCARERQTRLSVMLKVDCGGGRAGIDPTHPDSLALAARLHSSEHIELSGILTHAGQSYACHNPDEIRAVARHEREVMVSFADRLRQAGTPVPEVSIGSTPTCMVIDDLHGITEVRPGNYLLFDAFQAAIGVCSPADIALTVLVTVIGSYPERSRIAIDGGALALSKDPGATHVDPECGYGVVLSADGRQSFGNLRVTSLSQEHGLIRCTPAQAAALVPGTVLRIIPNHSCLSAAMFDRYYVLDGEEIIAIWRPTGRW
jgi:D-serine deaminase-like pyridoxal phosphate-dependent protein